MRKAFHDNFIKKGWSWEAIDSIVRHGKTIRQRVHTAKEVQDNGGEFIGKLFYQELREHYDEDDSPKKRLKVDDQSEWKDARIHAACEAIVSSKMDFKLLKGIFEMDCVSPSQRNAKAMFATLLEVPLTSDRGSSFLCMAAAYINMNELHLIYADLWSNIVGHIDKAFEKSYTMMSAAKLSASLWFDTHSDYIDIVLDTGAMSRCINNKTRWAEVEDDLVKMCKTHCGKKIFASKLADMSANACEKQLEVAINALDQ